MFPFVLGELGATKKTAGPFYGLSGYGMQTPPFSVDEMLKTAVKNRAFIGI
jgi:hypothetical protein